MTAERTIRAAVSVTGVVQGVGFRPFVYRTAVGNGLAGSVKNTGDGRVEIVLEGAEGDVEAFVETLRHDPPPLARIDTVDVTRGDLDGLEEFEIVESTTSSGGSGTIPPDTAMCDNCLADMRDPDSRYVGYWATACVDCGPRYTVIRDLPYDRPTTSMDAFPMCDDCRAEYEDPADRRYHAQTIACPQCGPELSLLDPAGTTTASGDDAIARAGRRLREGDLVAIKGIGGSHLACDATDPDVVATLRDRTGRPEKPFALMAPNLEAIREFAAVSDAEAAALRDTRRPIVLLEQDGTREWSQAVSPGLHTVGVMLPYSGLHHLLFDHVEGPLVMTSANLPGVPMAITTEDILADLEGVLDAALVHDREIVARCDDSVVRYTGGERRFIRRSRGWIPQQLPRRPAVEKPEVLALGAEFDATIALTQGRDVFPSQYLGDVDSPETLSYLTETVDHLTELLGIDPDLVACDMHPAFLTTRQANEYASAGLDGPVQVQHHHAHAASLLAERDVERAIVVAADGTGYGTDGTIWGGEVLDATRRDFERVGGLAPFRLPGGTAAIERPARILASLLDDDDRIDELLEERGVVESRTEARTIRQQTSQAVNAPQTTSAGRYLDAVSALLGVATTRSYEGEPAMKLEAAAAAGTPLAVDLPFADHDGRPVLDVATLLDRFDDLQEDHEQADVAATAQAALGNGLAELAVDAANERGVETVGFTGGVAYNDAIYRTVESVVTGAGLELIGHDRVPPGDGGISYGQVVVASARARRP